MEAPESIHICHGICSLWANFPLYAAGTATIPNQQKLMIFMGIHQDMFFKQNKYHKINHLLKGRNIL